VSKLIKIRALTYTGEGSSE